MCGSKGRLETRLLNHISARACAQFNSLIYIIAIIVFEKYGGLEKTVLGLYPSLPFYVNPSIYTQFTLSRYTYLSIYLVI